VAQEVIGGLDMQETVHSPAQLFVSPPPAAHCDSQSPEQLNDPGLAEQFVMQVAVHVSVQLELIDAVHIALQDSVKLTGVHSAEHPPLTTNWQLDGSGMSTTVPSLAVHWASAKAFEAPSSGAARAKAPART
jgi:hypothetical protein